MKSATLTAVRKVDVRDVPAPRVRKDTDVLLRVDTVGVCGSDIHYYSTGRVGNQVIRFPFRIGHECSATVVQVGRRVKRVKAGDRVAVDPAAWCWECDQCKVGRFHTCRKLTFLGTPGQGEGCLCECLVMPEASCYPIRKKTTMEEAALVEPLSIACYAVKLADMPMRGKRIGILGSGPIGLSVLMVARQQGVGRVYSTDKLDYRLKAARRFGATWTGNPDRQDVVAAICRKEPLRLDCVFECCGKQEAMDQAVDLLKPGGTLVLVGIPEFERVSFAIDQLRRKEIRIQNVRRQNECVQEALDLIEKHGVKARAMITHRFSLEQTKKAFDLVHKYRDGVIKAMVRVG
jgi:L-iditol 2-dehydrogenase